MELNSRNLAHFWAYRNAPLCIREHFYCPSIDIIVNENAGIFRSVQGTREHDKDGVVQYVRSRVCSGSQNAVHYVLHQAELAEEMYEGHDRRNMPAKFAMMLRWTARIKAERKRRNG